MTPLALEISGLNKNFGAIQVTRNVGLRLEPGARHALIGPNGAGKTTLVNLLTGILKPTAGKIQLFGTDITHVSPEQRVGLGLVRTFQINSLFLNLTAAENLGLAVLAANGLDAKAWSRVRHHIGVVAKVAELLARVRLLDVADKRVRDLAYGHRRLIEIALALALQPKVLLLDEPAAGVASRDIDVLMAILNDLPPSLAVLLIEHDMNLVFRFARSISVLVEGAVLTEGTAEQVRSDERVHQVYLGRHRHD
jgi:branched-chain amino acid transport system ATP-binding protein